MDKGELNPGQASCCKRLAKKTNKKNMHFDTPALPLRPMTEAESRFGTIASGSKLSCRWATSAGFKSLGSSLACHPIPRLPTCVLSVTNRSLMQRPTSEFVSLCVAHIKEWSPTAPPSYTLINYTWWVWGPQKQLCRLNSRVNTNPRLLYLHMGPLSTQPRSA